jgi:hypothetical protein
MDNKRGTSKGIGLINIFWKWFKGDEKDCLFGF